MGTNSTNIQVVGRIASDVRVNAVKGDKLVTGFSIACDDDQKKSDGTWDEHTQFYFVDAWGGLGESAAKRLNKGDLIFLTGKLKQSVTVDPKSGIRYTRTKFWADSYRLLAKKAQPQADAAEAPQEVAAAPFDGPESMEPSSNDVPF